MEIVIYIFAAGFLFMSGALLYAYHRSRHYGLFLIGLSYGVGGIIAIIAADWWPLAAAFALGWLLRMAGLDPDPARKPEKPQTPSQ